MGESDAAAGRPRRRAPAFGRFSGCLTAGLALLVLPLAGATVLGFLGRLWWVFDLLVHFRIQYAAGLIIVAAVAALAHRRAVLAIVLSFVLTNLVPIAPYYLQPRPAVDPDEPTLRLLSLNVDDHRSGYEEVLALIEDVGADVVVLIEADQRWVENVVVLSQTYPYQVLAPREGFFGMVLMSKFPLDDAQILTLGEARLPSISARILTPATSLHLVATHPYPPVGRQQAALRNDQLAAVAEYVTTLPRPIVLAGDFNATPWSLPLHHLLKETGLRDSALGYGIQPSWPAGARLARIQIDNCLVSDDLRVVLRDVGPVVGSDHLPIIAELALPAE